MKTDSPCSLLPELPTDLVNKIMGYLKTCDICCNTFLTDSERFDSGCTGGSSQCEFVKHDSVAVVCQDCQDENLFFTYEGPMCLPCVEYFVKGEDFYL